MVIIWLMMVNNNLVGGAITILKNDGIRQWEEWHPIYEMENKLHVPNHQPVIQLLQLHSSHIWVILWCTLTSPPRKNQGKSGWTPARPLANWPGHFRMEKWAQAIHRNLHGVLAMGSLWKNGPINWKPQGWFPDFRLAQEEHNTRFTILAIPKILHRWVI